MEKVEEEEEKKNTTTQMKIYVFRLHVQLVRHLLDHIPLHMYVFMYVPKHTFFFYVHIHMCTYIYMTTIVTHDGRLREDV